MLLEIFVHVAHLEELFNGRPVNCKFNYASQYDVRLLIDPRKYKIVGSGTSSNLITIKKKSLLERLKFKQK